MEGIGVKVAIRVMQSVMSMTGPVIKVTNTIVLEENRDIKHNQNWSREFRSDRRKNLEILAFDCVLFS